MSNSMSILDTILREISTCRRAHLYMIRHALELIKLLQMIILFSKLLILNSNEE